MAVSLKHSKTSGKADGADSTLVQPSDWNAEHTLTLGTGLVLGRVTAGTGAAEELTGTQVTTLLDSFAGSLKGLVPVSVGGTTNFLRADGSWAAPTASLSNWTEAVNTSAPNATVPVVSFKATNGATNVDAAIVPKGTGALTAAVADSTATGGIKRGTNAVDLQTLRATNSQVASGNYSVVAGGTRGTASGNYSMSLGGYQSTASGEGSICAGGYSGGSSNPSTASGSGSICLGSGHTANSMVGTVIGGRNGTTRSVIGQFVQSPSFSPIASGAGITQSSRLIVARATTDATPTVLASDTNAASTTNQIILPNNSAYYFKGKVIANVTGAGNTSAWTFEGAIKRGANAASTTLVAAVTPTLVAQDAGASGWVLAVAADTTNGGLKVTVTGQAATTIRWVCHIETTEVTF